MRGTKKLPLEKLYKIHKDVIKKYNRKFPNDILEVKNGLLKKSDYNKKVSFEVYPKYKDTSWFTRFESGLAKAEEFMAKYWVFQDLNQPILEHLYEYAYSVELDAELINRFNSLFQQRHGNFVSNSFFIDLELKSKDIEINCIASDLSWLKEHSDKIVRAANENNSTFKYLLVNPQARLNLPMIKMSLSKLKNKEAIQIKEAYSQLKIVNNKSIDIHEILFPLDDDIVIYKNIPIHIQEEHGISNTMLAAGTDILDKNFQRSKQDFIISDDTKLGYAQIWFNTIWDACE